MSSGALPRERRRPSAASTSGVRPPVPPARMRACQAPPDARGLARAARQSPRVPTTRRLPITRARAKPQPAYRALLSRSIWSSDSSASVMIVSSSWSSRSVGRELNRGRNWVWKRLAQNSAPAVVLLRPSTMRYSAAGLSRKERGCLSKDPVRASSGSATARSSFRPEAEGTQTAACVTLTGCTVGLWGLPVCVHLPTSPSGAR
mmetsp:Transcript_102560/g.320644  ORF Transcript_102560/g.320644 Transcript_102560/m.320644 type:complete len:204 (-) Transcript_102560:63-674(-)